MFSMKSDAPEQFIDGGLARIPAGTAFMYLFRRYGYPDFYSYKAIAEYAVETSIPGAYVLFSIKHRWCYIYATAEGDVWDRYTQEEIASRGKELTEFCAQAHAAAHQCLLDQLRPVVVDGEPINIFGPGDFAWDEETEKFVGQVAYYEFDDEKRGGD